ncbi:MAG: carotenoid biosynthesis protein [Nitrospiraceae bacterium]
MEVLALLTHTVLLRPYVFLFLAVSLFSAQRLIGWRRTGLFFGITWATAFLCEFSSTRTGIPFGWYHYTGSTVGRELYLSNIPFMDSLSFTFLLYASYCLALFFLFPKHRAPEGDRAGWLPSLASDLTTNRSWLVGGLTVLFFVLIDIVIDPVALRGDRWFLGQIYWYPEPGLYFGVPIANFIGWAVVGLIALLVYFSLDQRLSPLDLSRRATASGGILLGCGLYYSVLLFNLAVTFWIGEPLLGLTGVLLYLPVTALFLLRLLNRLPAAGPS